MTAPNATLTNGRYELPPHARGVLILADPPVPTLLGPRPLRKRNVLS
jgi:hypothetical protein